MWLKPRKKENTLVLFFSVKFFCYCLWVRLLKKSFLVASLIRVLRFVHELLTNHKTEQLQLCSPLPSTLSFSENTTHDFVNILYCRDFSVGLGRPSRASTEIPHVMPRTGPGARSLNQRWWVYGAPKGLRRSLVDEQCPKQPFVRKLTYRVTKWKQYTSTVSMSFWFEQKSLDDGSMYVRKKWGMLKVNFEYQSQWHYEAFFNGKIWNVLINKNKD